MKYFKFLLYSVLCFVILSTNCGFASNILMAESKNDVLSFSAKSALLIDYNSNEVLYEKDSNAKLPIASMVKLMTILLTCESIERNELSVDELVQTSENASGMGGSQVFIDPFVSYKAGQLLKSVVLSSANDSSVALAEHLAGSESVFVDKMNKRAKELGMTNTLYANCTGLPAPEQYSCANDCAIVLKELTKHEIYHQYSSIWMEDFVHPSGRKTEMVNTNKLIRYYQGCDGGKTGSTSEAGYCLSATAQKGGMRIIAVVIGAKTGQDRFKEVTSLFNYGFANFENKTILDCSNAVINIDVDKAKTKQTAIFAERSAYGLCKKGENNEYQTDIQLNQDIVAPIKSGEVVGKLIITKNGKVIDEINLIVKEDIEKITLKDGFKKIISNW